MERFFRSDFFYHFRHAPVAIVSFVTIILIILAAIFANFIAPTNPFDPASLNLMNGFTPPLEANEFTGERFLLGTDDQGRDLFSTILYGLRISLFVGLMAVLLAMVRVGLQVCLILVRFGEKRPPLKRGGRLCRLYKTKKRSGSGYNMVCLAGCGQREKNR